MCLFYLYWLSFLEKSDDNLGSIDWEGFEVKLNSLIFLPSNLDIC